MKLYYVITNAYNCIVADHGDYRATCIDDDHAGCTPEYDDDGNLIDPLMIDERTALELLKACAENSHCDERDGWDETDATAEELTSNCGLAKNEGILAELEA